MRLDNKCIHDQCRLVEETDFDEAKQIGLEMMKFAKENKYISLAANQVGHDMQIIVAKDDDGYDVYFNPEIEPKEISNGMFTMEPQESEFPAIVPSFPKKRMVVKVFDTVEINTYSLSKDDRITFTASDELAKIWQITTSILGGVNMESIVPCDFRTIKSEGKKKPNARCEGCGKKNKKCICND